MVMYKNTKLVQIVKGKQVKFEFYRKGELWYSIEVQDDKLLFPVPISDTGDGTFNASDKATMFMRYIRKHLEDMEKENETNTQGISV